MAPDLVAMAIISAGATSPALPSAPNTRTYGCVLSTHSAVGLYEFTLDGGGISAVECADDTDTRGGVADADVHIEHVSDTVKRVRTNVAGTPSDALGFSLMLWRMPAGH